MVFSRFINDVGAPGQTIILDEDYGFTLNDVGDFTEQHSNNLNLGRNRSQMLEASYRNEGIDMLNDKAETNAYDRPFEEQAAEVHL